MGILIYHIRFNHISEWFFKLLNYIYFQFEYIRDIVEHYSNRDLLISFPK